MGSQPKYTGKRKAARKHAATVRVTPRTGATPRGGRRKADTAPSPLVHGFKVVVPVAAIATTTVFVVSNTLVSQAASDHGPGTTPSSSSLNLDPVTIQMPDTKAVDQVSVQSKLLPPVAPYRKAGDVVDINPVAMTAYRRAAVVMKSSDSKCSLRWELVAALGAASSGHGKADGAKVTSKGVVRPHGFGIRLDGTNQAPRADDSDAGEIDDDKRFDRTVGPFRFLPAIWKAVAVDADGDGHRDPHNIHDASLAAAVYLCSDGDLDTPAAERHAVSQFNSSSRFATYVVNLTDTFAEAKEADVVTNEAPTPEVIIESGTPTSQAPSPSSTPSATEESSKAPSPTKTTKPPKTPEPTKKPKPKPTKKPEPTKTPDPTESPTNEPSETPTASQDPSGDPSI